MDLSEIHIKIEKEFSQITLLNLITTLEDSCNNLDEENSAILLKWLEFEFLCRQMSIYETMKISWSAMKDQISSEANQELKNISKIKKRNIKYLQKWIVENKSNYLKVEEPASDLSDTSATEKIIYLQKLGVIDFLRSKQPFISVPDKVSQVLSAITGVKIDSIRPMVRPIINKDPEHSKNPLNSKNAVERVEKQLIKMGFNLDETI